MGKVWNGEKGEKQKNIMKIGKMKKGGIEKVWMGKTEKNRKNEKWENCKKKRLRKIVSSQKYRFSFKIGIGKHWKKPILKRKVRRWKFEIL